MSGPPVAPAAVALDRRLPTRTLLAIVATELVALGSLAVPLMLGLALAVNRIDTSLEPEGALAVVTACGALAAMVANPIFGGWCDRTRDRGAGRAAFLLGGVLAGVAAVALIPLAADVWSLTAAWMLAQAAFNATFAALYGLIADLVPEPDRSRVSGWFGGAAVGSVVVGMSLVSILPKTLPVVVLTMPVLAVPVSLAAFWHLRRLSPPAVAPVVHGRQELRRWHLGLPTASAQYWLVWLQRFLAQCAYGMVTIFGLFYLLRRTDLAEDQAVTWVAAASAVAGLLSILASIVVGARAGRRGAYGSYIGFALALIAIALVVKATGTTPSAYLVAALLVGVGIGCYYAVDLALVLRAIPAERAGLLMGFFNVARTLPQSLVPAVAPLLLAIGDHDPVGGGEQNYTALYVVGLVIVLASVFPMRWMRILRREDAEDPRAEEQGADA